MREPDQRIAVSVLTSEIPGSGPGMTMEDWPLGNPEPAMSFSDKRVPFATALLAAVVLAGTVMTTTAGASGLAGSQWGYPLESGVADRRSVRFAVGGELFGNGGCNKFRGRYEQSDNTITISPLATTRKVCPDPIMAKERSFIAALTNARSAGTSHIKLVLLDADGTELLRLVRQDWD